MQAVSYSRIKRWRRCQKAHDYRYNQKLSKKRKPVALFRGSLIHELLSAQTLKKLHPKGPGPTPDDVLRKASKKYRLFLREEREMHGDILGDAKKVFDSYNRHYADDPLETLSSEEFFATPLTSEIRFLGYIDKRVRDNADREWAADYKVVTRSPPEEVRLSDTQLIPYAWAWNRENPKKAVDGFLWDYIKKKPPTLPELLVSGKLTQRENIDTDYHTYLETIKAHGLKTKDYKDILERLKTKRNKSFQRIKYPLPPKPVIETMIEDLRQSAVEIQHMGKTSKVRSLAYDCDQCEFFLLCQAELRGLDSNYVRKTEYVEKENDHGEEKTEADND